MKNENSEELFKNLFKGSFVQDLMIKLYKNEISCDEVKKQVENKKNEINELTKSSNLDEIQKFNILMNINSKKEDIININNKLQKNTKVAESKNEPIQQENNLKSDKSLFKKKLFTNLYILPILFTLSLSIIMTFSLITVNKPFLVQNDDINEFGAPKSKVRMFEGKISNENINIEMDINDKKIKLNNKDHSFLILPKMKKIFILSYEGIIAFIAKYSMAFVNLTVLLFGKYINKKTLKKVKINVAIISFILPIIRIFSLIRLNKLITNNYVNNIEYYTQDQWIYNKIKPQTYKIYNEMNNCFYSLYLALMHSAGYIMESFFEANSWIDTLYNKIVRKNIKQM